MRYALLIFLLAFPASADEREPFVGTWGTAKQCAGDPIKRGGTVLAQPFEIRPGWLKQGKLWCGLKWGPVEVNGSRRFTVAHVRCGEDNVRDYFIRLKLVDEKLTLLWDFPHKNGPLSRCPKTQEAQTE